MLESIESINIKSLAAQEPRTESRYAESDPRRFVSPKQEDRINKQIELLKEDTLGSKKIFDVHSLLVGMLSNYKVLFPEREEIWKPNEEIEEELKRVQSSMWSVAGDYTFDAYAFSSCMKNILGPQEIDTNAQDEVRDSINNGRIQIDVRFASFVANIKILDNELFDEFSPTFEVMKYTDFLPSMKKSKDNKDWWEFLEVASMARVVFPDDAEFQISDNEWKEINKLLNSHKVFRANLFLESVYQASILAASEIKIGDTGIELVLPEKVSKIDNVIPSVPERRKF